jgi:processive 1,2-diacylglycerol beta-glucosyltransferase
MRVLILTASYGSGHNEAARSLAAEFERARATALIVDHFRELVHPRFENVTRALYYRMLRHARPVWGLAYELADRMASDSPLSCGMTRLGTARLAGLLDTLAPDAVVSVHATPAVVLSSLVVAGRRVPPHVTVVTDFVAHTQWIAPHIDRFCVAADEVRHEFIARGIPPERIVVTGVPVRVEFEDSIGRSEARVTLGLSPLGPVVLAMAGSDGALGRLPDVARVLADAEGRLEAIVVAGRNRALAERLRRIAGGRKIRVLDYASDVPTLMAASDMLITKAGGMTIAEALASELPLVLYGSLPGQERRNERFASRAGIALIARSRSELGHLIDRLLFDRDLDQHLRRRIRELRQPRAAMRIVSAVLDLARSATARAANPSAALSGGIRGHGGVAS